LPCRSQRIFSRELRRNFHHLHRPLEEEEKQEEAVVLNRRRSKTFTMMLSLLSRFCAEASAVRENCLAGGFLKISFFF